VQLNDSFRIFAAVKFVPEFDDTDIKQ